MRSSWPRESPSTQIAGMVNVEVPQYESPGVVRKDQSHCPRWCESASVLYAPPISEDKPEIHIRQGTDGVVMIGEGFTGKPCPGRFTGTRRQATGPRRSLPASELASAQRYSSPRRDTDPCPATRCPFWDSLKSVPNLYIALTHSGITLAPLIGEFATMEILDGARIDLLDPFRLERFPIEAKSPAWLYISHRTNTTENLLMPSQYEQLLGRVDSLRSSTSLPWSEDDGAGVTREDTVISRLWCIPDAYKR